MPFPIRLQRGQLSPFIFVMGPSGLTGFIVPFSSIPFYPVKFLHDSVCSLLFLCLGVGLPHAVSIFSLPTGKGWLFLQASGFSNDFFFLAITGGAWGRFLSSP